MNSEEKKGSNSKPADAHRRRPYQKPAFRHERVFETMALACGKIDITQLSCGAVPKFS